MAACSPRALFEGDLTRSDIVIGPWIVRRAGWCQRIDRFRAVTRVEDGRQAALCGNDA